MKAMETLDEETIYIETQEPLNVVAGNYVIENLSANPEIEIRNCECGNNRPRGFLLRSPKKQLWKTAFFTICMLESISKPTSEVGMRVDVCGM